MASFTDVFQRKEIKYLLSGEQYRAMQKALEGRLAPDEYGRTTIISCYYDTPHRDLIVRSLEKPLYKEKLRLRSYGEATPQSRVFLEIKKKYDGIVYKRRVGMTLAAAQDYLSGTPYQEACAAHPLPKAKQAAESLSARSIQISHEIDAFVDRYEGLAPSMLIEADRVAYAPVDADDPDTSGVRITFDERVRYRDLFDDPGARAHTDLLPDDTVIMEIKVPGAFPLWLAHALSDLAVYPTSFSKYGNAYLTVAGAKAPAANAPEFAVASVRTAAAPARHVA